MMMTDLIGKTLKGYRLIDHIGEGGFGAVYRAEQQVVNREVAVKVILPQFANSPEFVRRFDAEAQYIARLEHPHIVPLFDYWRDPDGAYLVMRYVSGGSLSHLIRDRSLRLEEVARLLDEITAALSVAHRNDVVHLDLKPDNILSDDDGNFYLTDFGIAKTIGTPRDPDSGRVSGTLSYAAPEQIKNQPISAQSDVYSMGIILYEVLTGEHPFAGKSATAMIVAHLTEDLPFIRQHRPDLPLHFDDIIQQATAKHPADRYEDVREIAIAFRSAIENQDTTITTQMLAALGDIENPYQGLRPFAEADAQNFFGREDTVERLAEHLWNAHFLAVVGPSGSGKSSVVSAGLIPALRKGLIPGSSEWFIVEMVPGGTPFLNLAAALDRVATRAIPRLAETLESEPAMLAKVVEDMLADKDGELLLFIDQFEEIFTQVEREERRLRFLEMLRHALTVVDVPLRVVVTLRADFYDRPLRYEGFGTLIQQHTEAILPLSAAELERAIVGPAERVGFRVDADLIATMTADVREEPGALPLLQYALTEVFEKREGTRLTLEAYQSSGGVSGALAKRAEEVFSDLRSKQKNVARQLFLRLVTLGEGEEDTRRRVRYSELITLDARERVQDVLDRFGKYRLLTFDTDPETREPLVEVAHEALIREWKRLRGWLDKSRNDVRQQRALNAAAVDWRDNRQERSYLLRGARLAQFEEWAAETDLELSEEERAFLDASLAERERLAEIERQRKAREATLEERARQRLRLLVAVLSVATVIGVSLTLLAFNRTIAETTARATSEFNAAEAEAQAEIASTAQERAESQASRAETQAALAATAENRALFEAEIAAIEANRARSLALSTAAQLIVQAGDIDTAMALALEANGYPNPPLQSRLVLAQLAYSPGTLRRFELGAPVDAVAMSDDGDRAVIAARDGTLTLWDLDENEIIHTFDGHTDRVVSVVLSNDGRRMVSGGWDDTAILWNTITGAALVTFSGHTENVLDVDLSDNGLYVATASADGTAMLWNARSGEPIYTFSGHDGAVNAVAISPDNDQVLTGSDDEATRLWGVQTGIELHTFRGHSGAVNAVDISKDNLYLSASDDGTLRVHTANFFAAPFVLRGHEDDVQDAVFTSNGQQVVSVSRDGDVITWDVFAAEEVSRFRDHDGRILSVGASEDGRLAITGASDNTARVWLMNPSAPQRTLNLRESTNPSIAFSPDGRRYVYGTEQTGVTLYAAAGNYQQQLRVLGSPFNIVTSVAYSPDGAYVAAGLQSREAELYRVRDGARLQVFGGEHTSAVTDIAFTPDGRYLLTVSLDTTVLMWDVETGEVVQRFTGGHEDGVRTVAVHPDGGFAISGSNDGSMVIWDLEQGREFMRLLGNRDAVYDLQYSPIGEFVYAALDDGTLRRYSIVSGREVNRFEGHRGAVQGFALSPDGRTLLTAGADGALILWDVPNVRMLNRFEVGQPIVSAVFHPRQPLVLTGGADGTVNMWRALSLDELTAWVQLNRYVPPLTCEERAAYNLDMGVECSGFADLE